MKSLSSQEVTELYETLKYVSQFLDKLEELKDSADTDIEGLPPSMIETPLLYNILVGYSFMYDYFLDNELIKSGQPKYNRRTQ